MWCRHQESNPGPTDYKSGQLLNRIKGWRLFFVREQQGLGLDFPAMAVGNVRACYHLFFLS